MKAELLQREIHERGYAVATAAFDLEGLDRLRRLVGQALQSPDCGVLQRRGQIYGARNLVAAVPALLELIRASPVATVVTRTLGPGAGLVRATYFDKTPGARWFVPWHKDAAIAVDRASATAAGRRVTLKAGVAHVDAPHSVLEGMLAARIHLDDATSAEGGLELIPGSHASSEEGPPSPSGVLVEARAGDILFMRPLATHRSARPKDVKTPHRRVLHLEFASSDDACAPLRWHRFDLVTRPGR